VKRGHRALGAGLVRLVRLLEEAESEAVLATVDDAGSHERGKEHRISFENLKTWSGSEGRMRDWVCTLEKALQELEKTGIIEKWEFGVGTKGEKQVRWVRSKE